MDIQYICDRISFYYQEYINSSSYEERKMLKEIMLFFFNKLYEAIKEIEE